MAAAVAAMGRSCISRYSAVSRPLRPAVSKED